MYLKISSSQQLIADLSRVPLGDHSHWMILLADSHQSQLNDIVAALNREGMVFFGAIVPGLIHDRRHCHDGAVVKAVTCIGKPVVALLDEQDQAWPGALPIPTVNPCRKPTLHLLIDCFSPDISGFLSRLFNRFGNSVNYFGGGVGNRNMQSGPVIFTPEGVYRNAALVAVLDTGGKVNVRHGWERLDGPFIASRTDKNVIQELNWEPAMDLYRRILPDELQNVAADELFTRFSPGYPFGIQKEGREDVVRDPIRLTPAGEMVCLSDVPENSVMYLEHANPERLIEAAGRAIDEVTADRKSPASCLVYDCYSRSLLLGEAFLRELEVVADRFKSVAPQLAVEGAIVLGEIASDGEQSLEFYNKTFVVSVTYE